MGRSRFDTLPAVNMLCEGDGDLYDYWKPDLQDDGIKVTRGFGGFFLDGIEDFEKRCDC